MTQCGASRWARPKEGTRNAQCGVRERGADVQRENDMSGVLNGGNSSGLVASSVLSDTASASALRVCVSGLRGCNLTTD